MEFKYKYLKFSDMGSSIRVTFLNIYYFYLSKKDLQRIGSFKLNRKSINFPSQNKGVQTKFNFLLQEGFNNLKSSINQKPALYIHKNSGLPLIGSNEFGIIDRGTNTIEIKPLTTCNIDCIFCSVDHTKRQSDIVVEPEYLVEELNKVIDIKEHKVNIHIGSQGDPSLYEPLVWLIKEMRKNKKINAVSMVTNGIALNKNILDRLTGSGLTHLHISLHSINQEKANILANSRYPVKKVMELCEYAASRLHLLLVPVWVPGINDHDIEDIIAFAIKIKARLGIQNFLEYRFGKRPVNPLPMKLFYVRLHMLEKKYGISLTQLDSDLTFHLDKKLDKPFRKGQIITVELKAGDRLKNAVLGVSENRVVTVLNCYQTKGTVKAKILRDKDNIFVAIKI